MKSNTASRPCGITIELTSQGPKPLKKIGKLKSDIKLSCRGTLTVDVSMPEYLNRADETNSHD